MGRRIFLLSAVAILIPACRISPFFFPLPPIVVNAVLRGSQVVPAVAAPVPVPESDATLLIADSRKSIDFILNYTSTEILTAVEIRLGAAGTNGPVLFTLAAGPISNPFMGTLADGDLTWVPSESIFSIQAAIDQILAGKTYVLARTTVHPNGQMRGQLGAVTLASAALTGAQVTPAPVAGPGTGTFTAAFDSTQDSITMTLTFSGLTSAVTSAHIHFGAAGAAAGPAVFDLPPGPFASPLVVTLTSADFNPDPTLPSYAHAVDAFLTGLMYVDIHAAPEEIRGQIGPVRLAATMTGPGVAPPVVSGFVGNALVILDPMQTQAQVSLTHNVLTPNSVRLCTEDPGFNGPLLFDVDALAGSAASPLEATLHESELIPSPPRAILTFADFVNAALTKKTYLEVRSPSFPNGAIRGQLQ